MYIENSWKYSLKGFWERKYSEKFHPEYLEPIQ